MFSYEGDVYAWKCLKFPDDAGFGFLHSPYVDVPPWETPQKHADCLPRCPARTVPHLKEVSWKHHTCGIYAYWTLQQLCTSEHLFSHLSSSSIMHSRCAVQIRVSGDVAVAQKGLRAQHAEIVNIITIDPVARDFLALRYAFPGVTVLHVNSCSEAINRFPGETEEVILQRLGVTVPAPADPPKLSIEETRVHWFRRLFALK